MPPAPCGPWRSEQFLRFSRRGRSVDPAGRRGAFRLAVRAFYAGCRELGRERFGRWPVDAPADPSRVIGLRQTKAAQLGGLRERKACWRNWDDDQARVHDDLTPGRAGARNGVGSLGAFDSLRLARLFAAGGGYDATVKITHGPSGYPPGSDRAGPRPDETRAALSRAESLSAATPTTAPIPPPVDPRQASSQHLVPPADTFRHISTHTSAAPCRRCLGKAVALEQFPRGPLDDVAGATVDQVVQEPLKGVGHRSGFAVALLRLLKLLGDGLADKFRAVPLGNGLEEQRFQPRRQAHHQPMRLAVCRWVKFLHIQNLPPAKLVDNIYLTTPGHCATVTPPPACGPERSTIGALEAT